MKVLLIQRSNEPYKNHWAFPNIAYEMILTGEKATETIVNEVFKNFCVGK